LNGFVCAAAESVVDALELQSEVIEAVSYNTLEVRDAILRGACDVASSPA